MLIKKVRLLDREGLFDIRIADGKFSEIAENIMAKDGEEIIEGNGVLASAPFIEPHIHLDTTLTAGEPEWNKSGTLFEGIERWSQRKEFLTKEDVKNRAKKAIEWQVANGIQFIRTHVDVTDESLVALKAMVEVREEVKDYVTLQIVAFPQEGILSYPNGLELVEEAIKLGADVIGAIPHFEFTREYGVESINKIFELAKKYDVLIDVHCDEIDDEQSRFLEVVAARALESGLKNKVTASHTTAMGSYNNAYTYKLFRLLKMSGINFVSNPLVNTHLQGRFDTYPKRRGITRVKELYDNGINVCFAQDSMSDPWYPLGNGNMMMILDHGIHIAQMMSPEEIQDDLDLVTTNGAITMHIQDRYGIEEGKPANFIVLDAKSEFDAICERADILASVRKGEYLFQKEPAKVIGAIDLLK